MYDKGRNQAVNVVNTIYNRKCVHLEVNLTEMLSNEPEATVESKERKIKRESFEIGFLIVAPYQSQSQSLLLIKCNKIYYKD